MIYDSYAIYEWYTISELFIRLTSDKNCRYNKTDCELAKCEKVLGYHNRSEGQCTAAKRSRYMATLSPVLGSRPPNKIKWEVKNWRLLER